MPTQPTQHEHDHVPTNPTGERERVVDELLAHLVHSRTEADTPDDGDAERAWARIARLALRVHGHARTLATTLQGPPASPSLVEGRNDS